MYMITSCDCSSLKANIWILFFSSLVHRVFSCKNLRPQGKESVWYDVRETRAEKIGSTIKSLWRDQTLTWLAFEMVVTFTSNIGIGSINICCLKAKYKKNAKCVILTAHVIYFVQIGQTTSTNSETSADNHAEFVKSLHLQWILINA